MDKYFEYWYTYVLAPWEGGIADRPPREDPGGYTNRGVTLKIWAQFAPKLFKIAGTKATLSKITLSQSKRIAYEIYWKFYGIDIIKNPAIKILVAESVWGGGGFNSLGYTTGTTAQKVAAINSQNSTNKNLFDTLVQRRLTYLRGLSNYNYNKGGWEGRVWKGDNSRLSLTQVVQKYKLNVSAVNKQGGLLHSLVTALSDGIKPYESPFKRSLGTILYT